MGGLFTPCCTSIFFPCLILVFVAIVLESKLNVAKFKQKPQRVLTLIPLRTHGEGQVKA